MRRLVAERSRLRQLAWLMPTASAFVLALAALLAPSETATSMPAARVVVRLPAALVAGVVAALAVAELVLFAVAVFSGRRQRKRKGEEDFELY